MRVLKLGIIFVIFLLGFSIQESYSQYRDETLVVKEMEWVDAVEQVLLEFVKENLLSNKNMLKDTILIEISGGLNESLPPQFFVSISYDFIENEVIRHMDSKYKIDFGPLARTPEHAKLEIISESVTDTDNGCPQGHLPVNMYFSIKDANLTNLCYDPYGKSLIATIETSSQPEFIHLYIPRILLDAKSMDCKDSEFFVLVNGEEREYVEEKLEKFRTIKVPLHSKDIEIEIGVPLQLESVRPTMEQCQKLIEKNYRPFQQFQWALNDERIICKAGLEKITKKSDDSIACVKPKSIPKLIERGWGHT